MKKKHFLLVMVCLGTLFSFGQNERDYWIFGHRGGPAGGPTGVPMTLNFSPSAGTVPTTNFSTSTNINPPPPDITLTDNVNMGWEGTAVATDPQTGELYFYTDGNVVYDENHNDVTPAGGLGGHNSGGQPAAICVKPSKCEIDSFYIFSNPTSSNVVTGPVTYRIYDKVTDGFTATQNLPLAAGEVSQPNVSEGMLVIPSSNDPYTFWLITHVFATDEFRVYKIDPSGIAAPQRFFLGPNIPTNAGTANAVGNFAYTPVSYRDNTQGELAVANAGADNIKVFTLLFNAASGSGVLSTPLTITTDLPSLEYDVEFSPDGF